MDIKDARMMIKTMIDSQIKTAETTCYQHQKELAECVNVLSHVCIDDDESFVSNLLNEAVFIMHKTISELHDKQEHQSWSRGGDGELSDGEYDFMGYCENAMKECRAVIKLSNALGVSE